MSSTLSTSVPAAVSLPQPLKTRLQSLDIFRGATIAAMILVNNAGDERVAYWPLQHAKWNGWTPTDLIFPFFLFIVGVAMAFSFSSRLKRGESRQKLIAHVLWRGFLIFAIGVFLNGFPNHYQLDSWRIYGVLQRIAICYVITAFLELWADWRTQLGVVAACLIGYWCLMRYVAVPGFGVPTHDMRLLDPDRNIVAWLDRKVLAGHLYEGTRDPEGILSTIPAIATSLLGLLTGKWIRSARSETTKAASMAWCGVVFFIAAEFLNTWFPINKKLWTSSFVLLTAGLALVCLAFCYWILDVRQWRGWWTKPFLVFGMNSIAAYVFAEVIAHLLDRLQLSALHGNVPYQEFLYESFFVPFASPANASLFYAITCVLVCLGVMWFLYRKGIFLKI
ncbi:MAG TPA: heparan-alpha-glucosaminide N-acetyltransferase domain-containing protein [Terriglobales bacterium]|nr:heparan-alpha-glucosaminide N-acetyltransferase domain-containing protein [Terriglobales bacterium]